jgi:hypothetical protein
MKCRYKSGDRLSHSVFGVGTLFAILSPTPFGDALIIDFDNYGRKELIYEFCRRKIRKTRAAARQKVME